MSDSSQPHGLQRTRLLRPWDFPGKNTGVGCYFLLQFMKVKSENEVAQSCPTLGNPKGLQPTRLLRPWDFPGKSTGVGCHCLLHILATPLSKIKILQENQTHPSKKAFQQPLVATQAIAPTPNIDTYIHILRVLTEAFLSLTQDIFPERIPDRYGFLPFTLPGSFSTSER